MPFVSGLSKVGRTPRVRLVPMAMRCVVRVLSTLVVGVGCSNGAAPEGGPAPLNTDDTSSPVSLATTPASSQDGRSTGSGDTDPADATRTPTDEATTSVSRHSSGPVEPSTSIPAPDVSTTHDSSAAPTVETDCSFDITAEVSERIGTVVLVTFATDLANLDGGYIEFGLDTNYAHRAPLDLLAPGHRTMLLGMTAATQYHYRIVAHSGSAVCRSEDQLLTTGALPDDVPIPSIRASTAANVAPGYVLTSAQATGASGGGYYMVIYDHLGQPVWWYRSAIGGLVTRAKLSWDGKYIYGRDGNPSARSGGQVVRVAIDGSTEESLTVDTGHHDLAVTPDNGVLFLVGGGGDGCSRIEKWSATDEVSDFYDLRDAFGDDFKSGNDPCHCNSIHYNAADASITVSCLMQNAYVKVSEAAELLWVLGGNNGQSHFTGDVAWDRQHGHQMLTPNRILFLNNNGGGDSTSESSLAVELELDVTNQTAQRVWEYDGKEVTQTLGDVQRLPNGNTLVTYCNAGILHEVDAARQLVRSWQFTNGVGYAEHRESLYGPPARP